MTKLLICGSRNFGYTFDDGSILTDHAQRQIEFFHSTLDNLVSKNKWRISEVISGGATGADYLADRWAKWQSYKSIVYPAEWQKYKREAGPIRNEQMLKVGKPDIVIAFYSDPDNPSKGTSHMVEIAKKAGVTTYEFGF